MENPPGTPVRQLPADPEIRSAHLWSGVVAFFAWAFGTIVLVAALGGGIVQVSTYGATLNVLFPLWLLAGSALVLSWAIAIGRYRRELLRLDSQSPAAHTGLLASEGVVWRRLGLLMLLLIGGYLVRDFFLLAERLKSST